MEQEILTEKLSQLKESNRITKLLDLVRSGTDRFPVNVKAVVLDLTPNHNFRKQADGQPFSFDLMRVTAQPLWRIADRCLVEMVRLYQAARRDRFISGGQRALGEIQRESVSVWQLLYNPPRIQRSVGSFAGSSRAVFISCTGWCAAQGRYLVLTKKWSSTASTRNNTAKHRPFCCWTILVVTKIWMTLMKMPNC